WVRRGGKIVLSVARNQQLVGQVLGPTNMPLIDCKIDGTLPNITQLDAVERWSGSLEGAAPLKSSQKDGAQADIPLARLTPGKDVEVMISQGKHPIMVQAPCGIGRVVLVGFDLDSPPFTTWQRQDLFWQKLNAELQPKANDPSKGQPFTPVANPFQQ